jgi:hypothetical protein
VRPSPTRRRLRRAQLGQFGSRWHGRRCGPNRNRRRGSGPRGHRRHRGRVHSRCRDRGPGREVGRPTAAGLLVVGFRRPTSAPAGPVVRVRVGGGAVGRRIAGATEARRRVWRPSRIGRCAVASALSHWLRGPLMPCVGPWWPYRIDARRAGVGGQPTSATAGGAAGLDGRRPRLVGYGAVGGGLGAPVGLRRRPRAGGRFRRRPSATGRWLGRIMGRRWERARDGPVIGAARSVGRPYRSSQPCPTGRRRCGLLRDGRESTGRRLRCRAEAAGRRLVAGPALPDTEAAFPSILVDRPLGRAIRPLGRAIRPLGRAIRPLGRAIDGPFGILDPRTPSAPFRCRLRRTDRLLGRAVNRRGRAQRGAAEGIRSVGVILRPDADEPVLGVVLIGGAASLVRPTGRVRRPSPSARLAAVRHVAQGSRDTGVPGCSPSPWPVDRTTMEVAAWAATTSAVTVPDGTPSQGSPPREGECGT